MKVRKFIKKNAEGYLYVMPLIIGLLLFTFYPRFNQSSEQFRIAKLQGNF